MNLTVTWKTHYEKILMVFILLVAVACAGVADANEPRSSAVSFTVQVASFKNIGNAKKLCNLLSRRAGESYFKTVTVANKGTWYPVFTGSFETRDDAVTYGRRLKKKGLVSQFKIRKVRQAKVPQPLTKAVVKKDTVSADVAEKRKSAKPETLPQKMHPDRPGALVSDSLEKATATLDAPALKVRPGNQISPTSEFLNKRTATIESPALKVRPENQTSPPSGFPHKETAKSQDVVPADDSDVSAPAILKTRIKESTDQATNTDAQPLYAAALRDFRAERYDEALTKFKEILAQGSGTPAEQENAARLIGHCYYFLGRDGSNQQLFNAIDQYKQILRHQTGVKKDDDIVFYRLADSYMRMKLNYEALSILKKFETSYPDSSYRPDSMMMMGEILYRMRKYPGAIEKFRAYITHYQDEKNARDAYFYLGDCYSLMGDFRTADRWYGKALQKWPAMEELTNEELMKLGTHYLRSEQYERANEVFFTYVNLYIDDPERSRVLYSLSRSFIESGRNTAGLMLLSHIMEQYPESREARDSAIAMADVGIATPDISVPEFILSGIDNYRHPIATYDVMIKESVDAGMKEKLLFQRGDALLAQKKFKEAFDTFRVLVKRYPFGKYRNQGRKSLVRSGSHLVDGMYGKEDYLAVADIYFKTKKAGLSEYGTFEMRYRIGLSLNHLGLSDDAAMVIEEMRDAYQNGQNGAKLKLALADINYTRGRNEDAEILAQDLVRNTEPIHRMVRARALRLLADINYRTRHFKEAAGFYADALSSDSPLEERETMYKRYADSLKAMGFISAALVNYEKAVRACTGTTNTRHARILEASYEGLGECFFRMGNYDKGVKMYEQVVACSPRDGRNPWNLYNLGLGYLELNKAAEADQVFARLQATGQGGFWETLVAYSMNEKSRAEGYERYVTY